MGGSFFSREFPRKPQTSLLTTETRSQNRCPWLSLETFLVAKRAFLQTITPAMEYTVTFTHAHVIGDLST